MHSRSWSYRGFGCELAEMNLELTIPGTTQTLIITRAEFRTPGTRERKGI